MRIRFVLATMLLALAQPAAAHDTWLAPLPPDGRGGVLLELGTGNRFPVQETPVSWGLVHNSGCRAEGVREAPMRRVSDRSAALRLRSARAIAKTRAASCHVQLAPIELEIEKETIVQAYLDEIQAPAAVRQHWSTLRERGVRWRESYAKHARIELGGVPRPDDVPLTLQALAVPGLGMDARVLSSRWPLRAGDVFVAQVLRDGQPLPGQAVQLVNDLSPLGLWRTTDAQGMIEVRLPLAARWLLRGTDLRVATEDQERWESRFLTLAFEVLPMR